MTESTETPIGEGSPERSSARTSVMLTPTERAAVEFVREVHAGKLDSIPDVLRQFSINDCVAFHQRALAAANRAA